MVWLYFTNAARRAVAKTKQKLSLLLECRLVSWEITKVDSSAERECVLAHCCCVFLFCLERYIARYLIVVQTVTALYYISIQSHGTFLSRLWLLLPHLSLNWMEKSLDSTVWVSAVIFLLLCPFSPPPAQNNTKFSTIHWEYLSRGAHFCVSKCHFKSIFCFWHFISRCAETSLLEISILRSMASTDVIHKLSLGKWMKIRKIRKLESSMHHAHQSIIIRSNSVHITVEAWKIGLSRR